MRVPAAVATAVASLALLTTAWQLGVAPAVPTTPLATGTAIHATPYAAPAPDPADPRPTDPPRDRAASSPTPPSQPPATSPTTVDGAVVPTRYGDVQVRISIQDGHLTDVTALRLTDSNDTSRQISAGAAPVLRQEALDLQSAQIDSVSSATYTSEAYARSLQSALDAAGLP